VTQQHNRSNNQLAETTKCGNNQPMAVTQTATATHGDESSTINRWGPKQQKQSQCSNINNIIIIFKATINRR